MAVAANPLTVVALMGANMLMSALQEFEGPRVRDPGMALADYGTPMNYLVGTRFVAAPCIFAKPIEEKKTKRKGKGGKQTSYTGFCTWAAHVAAHEIEDVLQIWFDNQLVYDKTGASEDIYPLADDYELDMSLRIYKGTESQSPDPDMQAYIEARDGPGTCPAYCGEAYIYFQQVPVEKIGNRFPDVKVLVSSKGVGGLRLDTGLWRYKREAHTSSATYPAESFDDSGWESGYLPFGDVPWGVPASFGYRGTPANPYFLQESLHLRRTFELYDEVDSMTFTAFVDNGWTLWINGVQVHTHYDASYASADAVTVDGSAFRVGTNSIYIKVVDDGPVGGGDHAYFDLKQEVFGDGVPLGDLLTLLAETAEADPLAYDFSAATQLIPGFNWTQATGRQIAEALCDLYDVDLVPHDWKLVALPRGNPSEGVLASSEFADADPLFKPVSPAPTDLPQKVSLTFADIAAGQVPNTASPPGPDPAAANSSREVSIDMQTLALSPGAAQQLATRRLRRQRIGETKAEFALTRQRLAIEPGDVWTPEFDGHQMEMRATKTVLSADGRIETAWDRELAEAAALPAVAGAPAAGYIPPEVPTSVDSLGEVMDVSLVVDAHEQAAPFAYVVAGPQEPGGWLGADFAASDTGAEGSFEEGWAGINDGDGSQFGTVEGVLLDVDSWVPDFGSELVVTVNFGELTAATLDALLLDETLNLTAVRSGTGWELVQFMTPVLVGPRQYRITGFLRGRRGTEWAMAGHADGDTLVVLDTLQIKTLGASEIGDEDFYIVSATGRTPDEADAQSLTFTAAAHRPYSPVAPEQVPSGADLVFDAVRRTRLGGANVNGQDVPLGQASEAWELDILDGSVVVRTISATSLPITYTEAQQIADFGGAQSSVDARLYQIDPALNLRGHPLAFAA